ncbi:MAG: hypothetical protein ACFCUE_11910 [Candidatus Bathyarchaeia archaeon]|jgi:hypothetical protein
MENDGFSLDRLIVDEDEIRTPAIMPVTVLVSEIEYSEQPDISNLIDQLHFRMQNLFGFRKKEKKKYREGFLDFSVADNTLKCIFARESTIRLDFEKGDLRINSERLRAITSSFRVLVHFYVGKIKTRIVFFGGEENISSTALENASICFRGCLKGNFNTPPTSFSKEEMDIIRQKFGIDIQSIFLSPGESDKLRKIAREKVKGQDKEILKYFVRARFAGYRVIAAPTVLSLIVDAKIAINEIEGRLSYGSGVTAVPITTRVSSTGRITFFIPDSSGAKNQTAYDIAQELYLLLASKRMLATKQSQLGDFQSDIS